MSKLIVGCGYLGYPLARHWISKGHQVTVTTREPQRAETLKEQELTPLIVDVTDPQTPHWPEVDTIVYAVGFDRRRYSDVEQVYVRGLANVLKSLPPPKRFIYVSSSGVYGQIQSEWVDEDSPCQPTRPGGIACLKAEQLLQTMPWSSRVTILRLAGIYGPGRVPRQNEIKSGLPIPSAEGHLNLIHVSDAVSIIDQVAEHSSPANLYVVSDGHPVLRMDYYREVARILDAPEPTFAPAAPDSHLAQRATSDKRIRPQRLMRDFQPTLQFPTYKQGLAAILKTDSSRGD